MNLELLKLKSKSKSIESRIERIGTKENLRILSDRKEEAITGLGVRVGSDSAAAHLSISELEPQDVGTRYLAIMIKNNRICLVLVVWFNIELGGCRRPCCRHSGYKSNVVE